MGVKQAFISREMAVRGLFAEACASVEHDLFRESIGKDKYVQLVCK